MTPSMSAKGSNKSGRKRRVPLTTSASVASGPTQMAGLSDSQLRHTRLMSFWDTMTKTVNGYVPDTKHPSHSTFVAASEETRKRNEEKLSLSVQCVGSELINRCNLPRDPCSPGPLKMTRANRYQGKPKARPPRSEAN